MIARQLGNLFRLSGKFIGESSRTLAQDITEYLQEEARWLPTRTEVNYFLNDIDELRSDVDRVDARIQRLMQVMDSEP